MIRLASPAFPAGGIMYADVVMHVCMYACMYVCRYANVCMHVLHVCTYLRVFNRKLNVHVRGRKRPLRFASLRVDIGNRMVC